MFKTKKTQKRVYKPKTKTPLYVSPYRRPNNSSILDRPNIFQCKQWQEHSTNAIGQVIQCVYVHSPFSSPDWANLAGLYDLYKVLACKVEIFPVQTVSELGVGQAIFPVFWSFDPDSSSPITSLSAAYQYNNLKVIPVTSRGVYYAKPGVAYTGSAISPQQGVTIEYRGERWLNVANCSANVNGIIQWYGQSLPASQAIFNILITWTIKMVSRR